MDKDWRLYGACRDKDPEIFFPPDYSGPLREQRVEEAKTICAECPVRVTCLVMALETKWTAGIWGGTTEKERAELREKHERQAS